MRHAPGYDGQILYRAKRRERLNHVVTFPSRKGTSCKRVCTIDASINSPKANSKRDKEKANQHHYWWQALYQLRFVYHVHPNNVR